MSVVHSKNVYIIKPNNVKTNGLEPQKLHVVVVLSNAMNYKRRVFLARKFLKEMKKAEGSHMTLYVVELAYGDQEYSITQADNPHHLQLRTETPLWHKESMINAGVRKLLPLDWEAMAWIDADIEFDTPYSEKEEGNFVSLTLKALKDYNIVQMFSVALDMDRDRSTMNAFSSFGYKYVHAPIDPQTGYKLKEGMGANYWHPGFAWAIRRDLYEEMGGLLDMAVIGSGDYLMAMAITGNNVTPRNISSNYRYMVTKYVRVLSDKAILGYVPIMIRHNYHGSKKNRKYQERSHILMHHHFQPSKDVVRRDDGLIVPTNPKHPLWKDILSYFAERKEDD